jgi:hypothetical protein
MPHEFYTFARAGETAVALPLEASFGHALELLGYDYSIRPVVNAHEHQVTVTTYWRPRQALAEPYVFAFFFSRPDGAITGHYAGVTATGLWYPAHLWREGEIIRVETPILSVDRRHTALLAVSNPLADPWSAEGRQRPIQATGLQSLEVFQEESLLRLFSMP